MNNTTLSNCVFFYNNITLLLILNIALSSSCFASNDATSSPSTENIEYVHNTQNLFNLSLKELLNIKVTIASRTEKPIKTAPSSVTIFLREDILNMGIDSLDELLNFIPGVYSNRADLRGQRTIIRGHQTGDCSNGVLVLLNGARGNNAVCGGAFEHISYISMMDIERVEVIRGPGSAIYGSNAMIGVINIITRDTGNQINLSTGSIGFREVAAKFTSTFGDVDTSIFARYAEDNGDNYEPFYNFFGEFIPTKDPRKAMDITGNFKIGNLVMNASVIYRKNGEFISSAGGFGDLTGNVHSDNTRASFDINYGLEISETLDINLYANTQYYDNVWSSIIIPSGVASQIVWTNGDEVDYLGGNLVEGFEFLIGFRGVWDLSRDHRFSFGSYFQREKIGRNSFHGNYDNALLFSTNGAVNNPLPEGEDNIGFFGGVFGIPFNPNEIYLIDATSRNAVGGYIQSEYQMNDKTNITTGLRYDDYQDIGSNFSIRGAIVYALKENTSIKGMFGQAYRAPSMQEFNGEPLATGAIGNPDLGPETVDSIEFSITQTFETSQLSLTWFNNSFKNGIQNVQIDDVVPTVDTFQSQNVGELTTQGLEFEVTFQLMDNLIAKAGLSHFNKADEIGVPKTIGYWTFNYHSNRWNYNLNGYYRGSILAQQANTVDIINDTTISAYTHWNAKVSFDLTDNIELYGSASNLFNKDYHNYTTISDLPQGIPMRDITLKLGMSWTF